MLRQVHDNNEWKSTESKGKVGVTFSSPGQSAYVIKASKCQPVGARLPVEPCFEIHTQYIVICLHDLTINKRYLVQMLNFLKCCSHTNLKQTHVSASVYTGSRTLLNSLFGPKLFMIKEKWKKMFKSYSHEQPVCLRASK